MLRVHGKATLRRKFLAVYCLLALVLPGCGPRRGPSSDIPAPMVVSNHGKGKNPYKAIKEKDFSKHIRAVFRSSSELYDAPRPKSGRLGAATEDPEIEAAAQALDANPDDWETMRRLADLYLAAHRRFEAFQFYSRLQTAGRADAEVFRSLALIWDHWRDYPRALEYAVQAVAESDIPAEDWLFLGRIHLNGGNWQAATAALRKAADLDPVNREAFRLLGEAHAKTGDWETSAHFLRRAVDLNPAAGNARRRLAEVLVRQGEDEAALRQLLTLQPAAAAYNELGEILLSERRWAQAHEAFAAALLAEPGFQLAQTNLAATLPYLPLPDSVTLPSFETAPTPANLVALATLPEPIEAFQPSLSGYLSPPPGITAEKAPPAPLIIDVKSAKPSRLLLAGGPTARQETDPLGGLSVLRLPEIGNLEGMVLLPPRSADSAPPPSLEGTVPFTLSRLIRLPSLAGLPDARPRTLTTAALELSGIVQLPSWGAQESSSPAPPPEMGSTDAETSVEPAVVTVDLSKVRSVESLDLSSLPGQSPIGFTFQTDLAEQAAVRASDLIAVGSVEIEVEANPAAAVFITAPPLLDSVTVAATAVRENSRPEIDFSLPDDPLPFGPVWRPNLPSLWEDVIDLPSLPGVAGPGTLRDVRPSDLAPKTRKGVAAGEIRTSAGAFVRVARQPVHLKLNDPQTAHRRPRASAAPASHPVALTAYPRPFSNRGPDRFVTWRADAGEMNAAIGGSPLAAVLLTALTIGMLGAALARRRPEWEQSAR